MSGYITSMKKRVKKERIKPHFCYDVNLEFLQLRKECSQLAGFHSVPEVLRKQDAKDSEIIKECSKRDLHIITHDIVGFKNINKNIKIGIICIGLKEEDVWISKFSKLLRKYPKHKQYINKSIFINEKGITVKNRITGEVIIIF